MSGLRYRGCWYLNTRTGRLGSLEKRTTELSDDPFTRTFPVSKCGVASQDGNYNYFGVTLGYCISGSNLLSDYQYVSSQLCRDGRGGYNQGYFIMDVYQITNQQSFSDSVFISQNPTVAPTGDSDMANSSAQPAVLGNWLAIVSAIVIGLLSSHL